MQLQGELNLTLAVGRLRDHSGCGAGDSAVEKDRVRGIKVRMVQDVEEYRVQGVFPAEIRGRDDQLYPL